MNKELKDKIILESLGLLDKKESEELRNQLPDSHEEDKMLASEMNNLVSLFPKVLNRSLDKMLPSISVKEKLFSKINSSGNKEIKNDKREFNFIFSESDDWIQHPEVAGIQVRQLSLNKEKEYVMLLLKVAADTEYPSHHHSGAEECYVIEGDLYAQGKILGPGDFHHAEGGTDHEPLYTKNGCTVILVVDPKDY
ncbi:MAG: cupin domain-containing protein [Ignavibacteria bacterium]